MNDPYVSSILFPLSPPFPLGFTFLTHHAWVGVSPSNPFLYSQINDVKISRLLLLISMLTRAPGRFLMRVKHTRRL
jgi:hypothetical protein